LWPEGFEVVGRGQAREPLEPEGARREAEAGQAGGTIKGRWRERILARLFGDLRPKVAERSARTLASAGGEAVGHHHGVHGPGADPGDTDQLEVGLLQEPVEYAPGEGAMGTTALERQVDAPCGVGLWVHGTDLRCSGASQVGLPGTVVRHEIVPAEQDRDLGPKILQRKGLFPLSTVKLSSEGHLADRPRPARHPAPSPGWMAALRLVCPGP
jgi:hypothetical protein